MSFTKASSATGNATTAGAHLLAALALNAVGRRWATRALALEEADERKAQYLREGGILRAQSSPRLSLQFLWSISICASGETTVG
jgi:hypothetical protein